jgi:DNA-binding NarL/FixJ family response regulator
VDWLLLAEHNPLFREGLATLLEWRTGLASVYAGSLAEARGVLKEETSKPACIIVDLDLPDGRRRGQRTARAARWDTGFGAHQGPQPKTPVRGDGTGGR